MYSISIGNGETEAFGVGKASQKTYLYFIYAISTFTMLIHFLNMLIAIMSNTFEERKNIGKAIRSKDRLVFIMDNWQLLDLVFKDKTQFKYIFAAFSTNNNEQKDDQALTAFREHI